ncbi:hypothetical protein R5R35_003285 [Gryllus longicercus]
MVTGRVRLLLTHTVTLRGIELMFRGHSSVHWMESKYETDENNRSQSVNIPYTSEELHYHMKFFVFGDAYAGNILHAGEYNFNFTTQIPPNIPSSFEGEFGFIRHEMTILSYPTIGNTPTTYLLNVVNPLNLNNEPNIRSAVRVMDEKTLCCCCCASNPISCALFLPASGFGIGQDIPMTVEVDNLSGKVVKGVSVTLQRVDTFTAVRPERGTRKKIHKLVVLQLESVPRRRSCTWERNISVPDGPPSGLKYCSIISSEYLISMEVQLPAPHINMTINTPIIVGNIPLVQPGPPLPCSLPPNSLIGNFNSSDPPPPPYPYPVPSAPIIP